MAPKKKKNLGTGVVAGRKRKKIQKSHVEVDTDSTTDAQTEAQRSPRSPTPPPKDTATTSAPAIVPSTSTSREGGIVIGTVTELRPTVPKSKGKVPPSSSTVRGDVSESEANSDFPSTQPSTLRRGDSEASEDGGGSGVPDKSKIILTDDETSALIEFVKSNAPLWQRSHAQFKKEKEKYFIWQAGLETLKCFKTVDQIKAAWTNIRDTFSRMLREKNKSGGADFNPKGSKRIIIWGQANFLAANLCPDQPSNLTVSVKKRRVEPAVNSDFDEDFTITDSNPNSQPTSHLPHQQLAPSRPVSRPGSSTSGRTATATVVGGGGGDNVLISQSLVESLLKDKEVQIDSMREMIKQFPSVNCGDGGVMSFCNWLAGILMRIPEPSRSLVQGQISGYALSVMPTGHVGVPTMENFLQNTGQTLPPPPNYQAPLQHQQHQQQQPPLLQQHQQHQQPQAPPLVPQQPVPRGRSASAPMDYARQSPAPMRPPPPITRMPLTPRSGTVQGQYFQHMPDSGWPNTTNVASSTSTFQVYNSANVDTYINYSNLATDSAGRTVNLQDVSPANYPVVTSSGASPTLSTPSFSNLSVNPPSGECNVSLGTFFHNFPPPMSTSSVKSTEAEGLAETSQVVSSALESKNSE